MLVRVQIFELTKLCLSIRKYFEISFWFFSDNDFMSFKNLKFRPWSNSDLDENTVKIFRALKLPLLILFSIENVSNINLSLSS